ncbi:hypothetical protein C9J22_07535 [Photobacterium phosphoreum]|uniref:hypothetical protein n=1 Tax=Photobacterium phosphoreum TaxID=659 RepID=UPI000D15F754|nr:hypothetical protein [Photobacterium phosphoreum]PSU71625.1 hypothetical protein C9J22_07535 [Photobacterium phosphoreum]
MTYARSHIKECLDNGTTALLNNNKVTGYIVNAETFESMMNILDGFTSIKKQLSPDIESKISRAKKALNGIQTKSGVITLSIKICLMMSCLSEHHYA